MRPRHVPVTIGSPRFLRVRTPSVDVIAAQFPPHARLGMHSHERALFGIMVKGAFHTRIRGREVDYDAACAWTEPAEERHANVANADGARVVIVQPAADASGLTSLCSGLFDEILNFHSAQLLGDASRLEAECGLQDDLSPMVVEGLALTMLARGARLYREIGHRDPRPRWLLRALDYLHAHCLERMELRDVATSVGVHPSRLSHEFRARLGTSPGEFVRRLRLEWAAQEFLSSNATIADIALRSGFSDQSHFTRMFRRHFGIGPAAWRRSRTRQR